MSTRHPLGCLCEGSRCILTPPARAAQPDHFNSPCTLPPVGCPLLILVDGQVLRAERLSHVSSREAQLTYQLPSGATLTGRFEWTYP